MEKKLFKCEVCGQILEEGQLEDKCPKCGAPREKFHEMSEEDTAKSIRSEKTNDLHARLIDLTNSRAFYVQFCHLKDSRNHKKEQKSDKRHRKQ